MTLKIEKALWAASGYDAHRYLHLAGHGVLLKTSGRTAGDSMTESVLISTGFSGFSCRMLYKTTSLMNVWPSFKNGAVRRAKRVPAVSRPWLTSGITGQG